MPARCARSGGGAAGDCRIALPEARCQVDCGINAHLKFVYTPIFVTNPKAVLTVLFLQKRFESSDIHTNKARYFLEKVRAID